MEENSLQIKIKKQLEFLKDQITKFKRAFDTKVPQSQNFTPYLQALNKVFDLNNSYAEDYFEFIGKKQIDYILKNNRELMKDITFKLKGLLLHSQQQKNQTKEKPKKYDGICNICQHLIDSQNVQEAKNSVQDVGINKLKRMLKMIQQESNKAMFTAQQDLHFFQELQRVLTKKQQLLSITDNHLQKYLDEILKNAQEITYLQNLKDTSFPLPKQIDWQTKIKNQINNVLLGSFKGKVPPWIQKIFDYFMKIHSKFMRQNKQSKQVQTQCFSQSEIYELSSKIQEYKEQQRTNKAINQDYLKLIEQKKVIIENLQIKLKIFSENLGNEEKLKINKKLKKMSMLSQNHNVEEPKSTRNSEIKAIITDDIQLGSFGKSKSQHKLKKFPKMTSIANNTVNKSSIFVNVKNQNGGIQSSVQNQSGSFYGSQLRNQQLNTENLPQISHKSFDDKVSRKKQKKLTDIELMKRTTKNQKNQSFLPNLKKLLKESNQQLSNKKIKKTSILSTPKQSFNRFSQKNPLLQRSLFSDLNEKYAVSKSIYETDQDMSQSQINSIKNLTNSQRKIRLDQYKVKVTDVQNHLENKVQNIQALKRTFQMKKLNPSSSLITNLSPYYNEFNPLKKMTGGRFSSSVISGFKQKKAQMKDFTTQTEHQQIEKCLQSEQKRLSQQNTMKHQNRLSEETSKQNQIKKEKVLTEPQQQINVQTQQNKSQDIVKPKIESKKQSILKRLMQNQNIQKIKQEQLQKILDKLLSGERKQNDQEKSFSKTLNLQKDSEKQNQNQLSAQKQSSDAQKTSFKNQLQRKLKLISNVNSKDVSPKKKNKKFPTKNQDQQSLANISGIHTVKNKNQPRSLFTKKDFSLFLNEENSFKYESYMSKKYHKTPSIQLSNQEVENLTSAYRLTQLIKSHSTEDYNQIISFIKYPYHSVVNNFSILNMVKQMSIETWLWHFSLIKYYHQKCTNQNEGKNCICKHIEKFINKIQDTLVEIVRPKIPQCNLEETKSINE